MRTVLTLVPLALLLLGCLEHQEELTIQPDGAVSVRMRVKGGLGDVASLVGGYDFEGALERLESLTREHPQLRS